VLLFYSAFGSLRCVTYLRFVVTFLPLFLPLRCYVRPRCFLRYVCAFLHCSLPRLRLRTFVAVDLRYDLHVYVAFDLPGRLLRLLLRCYVHVHLRSIYICVARCVVVRFVVDFRCVDVRLFDVRMTRLHRSLLLRLVRYVRFALLRYVDFDLRCFVTLRCHPFVVTILILLFPTLLLVTFVVVRFVVRCVDFYVTLRSRCCCCCYLPITVRFLVVVVHVVGDLRLFVLCSFVRTLLRCCRCSVRCWVFPRYDCSR